MKLFSILFSVFIIQVSYSQDDKFLLKTACECFDELSNAKLNKVDFQSAYEVCFDKVYVKAILIDSATSEPYVKRFIERLNEYCDAYSKLHSTFLEMTLEKSEIKIKNKKVCKRTMQIGEFEEVGGLQKVNISMRDSVQITTFGDSRVYTKSKVDWIDKCSYRLTFIESTNPLEYTSLKRGDERVFRVIDVKETGEIILETELNGHWLLRRIKRID